MSTDSVTTVNPVAALYKGAYDLGVEHHSTCQLPTPREEFDKRYTLDDELLIGLDELYNTYRRGYRAGAPVVRDTFEVEDLADMNYADKLNYVKADPRFQFVGSGGFVYKKVTVPTIDAAYLYTRAYLLNGGE